MDATGHYREAEKLVASVMGSNPEVATPQDARDVVALAQVHATLATVGAPAPEPVEAIAAELRKFDELRAAVREFIAGEFDPDHLDRRLHRLRDLVGGA
jgi:antitoxin component HigA of HigAB toxin-antitoxin module